MIIDAISDLHGHKPKLPGGDLLIIAGDLTASDKFVQYEMFFAWLKKQNYRKKVFIAGNHDNQAMTQFDWHGAEYLCDSGTEFEGIKIWGSPWTKTFKGMNPECKAFTVDTEDALMDKFELIPHDTDILITHSPPYGILDHIPVMMDGSIFHAGSAALFGWLKYVHRPRIHVFGHIHEAYGAEEVFATYNDKMMISINASHVNEKYKPVNEYVRIEL